MKKYFKLIFIAIATVALTVVLSGCGNAEQGLDGKNIVTFELGGGTLETKTSSVNTNIKYAYEANTYIVDPAKDVPGYKLYRQGYDFTGWYTSAECKPEEKWDFNTLFNTETLTLYAGWKKAIRYTFSVYYVEGGAETLVGSSDVQAGDTFYELESIAKSRKEYTPVKYFSDPERTTPWDGSVKHPGGETDTDIKVYVDYIAGEWTMVGSVDSLVKAIKSNKNIYLTNDIECAGKTIINHSLVRSYNGIFEGNNHTVSNFKVEKYGSATFVIAIFRALGKNAEIRNVNFTDVKYDLTGIPAVAKHVDAAAIAIDAMEAKITNVTVSGTITTDYTGELPKLNEAIFNLDDATTVKGFSSAIVSDQVNGDDQAA